MGMARLAVMRCALLSMNCDQQEGVLIADWFARIATVHVAILVAIGCAMWNEWLTLGCLRHCGSGAKVT